MSSCTCSGNNGLRVAIGGVRCPTCGGRLEPAQVIHRLIDRLEEVEEDQFKMIGALQVLGADKCDQCGDWAKDCFTLLDRCRCAKCLEGNPEGVTTEDDDEDTFNKLEEGIVRYLAGRSLRVPKHLRETYLRISK